MGAFSNVKSLNSVAPAPKKGKTKELVEIEGLHDYSLLDSLVKTATTLRDQYKASVNETVFDKFIEDGKRLGHRPANFRGFENSTEASCELRKRSSVSRLSDEEVATFEANNIPYETIEDVVDTYVFDPNATAKDLAKAEKALTDAGLAHLILKQEGKARRVVSDETVDAVFANGADPELVKIATVQALKPSVANGAITEALALVSKLIAPGKVKAQLKDSLAAS